MYHYYTTTTNIDINIDTKTSTVHAATASPVITDGISPITVYGMGDLYWRQPQHQHHVHYFSANMVRAPAQLAPQPAHNLPGSEINVAVHTYTWICSN